MIKKNYSFDSPSFNLSSRMYILLCCVGKRHSERQRAVMSVKVNIKTECKCNIVPKRATHIQKHMRDLKSGKCLICVDMHVLRL